MLYQQGDVLIRRIERIPDGAKKIKPTKRGFILAEGEATGHAHRVAVSDRVDMLTLDDNLYLQAKWAFIVTHEEHGAVTIPPGDYGIGRVQEYDHFAEEARNVKD